MTNRRLSPELSRINNIHNMNIGGQRLLGQPSKSEPSSQSVTGFGIITSNFSRLIKDPKSKSEEAMPISISVSNSKVEPNKLLLPTKNENENEMDTEMDVENKHRNKKGKSGEKKKHNIKIKKKNQNTSKNISKNSQKKKNKNIKENDSIEKKNGKDKLKEKEKSRNKNKQSIKQKKERGVMISDTQNTSTSTNTNTKEEKYHDDVLLDNKTKTQFTTLSLADFEIEYLPPLPMATRRRKREYLNRLPPIAYEMFKYDYSISSSTEEEEDEDYDIDDNSKKKKKKKDVVKKVIKYNSLNLECICLNPNIYRIYNFLSKSEIRHLIKIVNKNVDNDKFRASFTDKSSIFEIKNEKRNVYSKERTSTFIFLNKHYDNIVHKIEQRAANILGVSVENIENLQIVRYTNGQEFTLHHDAGTLIELPSLSPIGNMSNGNGNGNSESNYNKHHSSPSPNPTNYKVDLIRPKRICSYFVYLNTLDENMGGQTEFPLINIKMRPVAGMAVLWANVNPEMTQECDNLLIHRAHPVIGENTIKYGMNIWVKEKKFDY